MAARCAHYLKPLLQAGTQGMLGSASVFVPDVTAGYEGPSSDTLEDAPYPACTIRHFPSRVEHTLQVGSTPRTPLPPGIAFSHNPPHTSHCSSPTVGTE